MNNHWILLACAIAAEVCGTTLLKYSNGFTRIAPTLGALAAFAVAFYLVSLVFRTLPVGITYAIWSGAGIVLTALIGWAFWGQKPDLPALAGMAMIIGGVAVIQLFSRSTVGH